MFFFKILLVHIYKKVSPTLNKQRERKRYKNNAKIKRNRDKSCADVVAREVPPRLGTQVLARSFQWRKMITMLIVIAQTTPPVKPPISHPLRAPRDTSLPPSERTRP